MDDDPLVLAERLVNVLRALRCVAPIANPYCEAGAAGVCATCAALGRVHG